MPRGGPAQPTSSTTSDTGGFVGGVVGGEPGAPGPPGPPGPPLQIRFVVKAVDLIDNYDAAAWDQAIGTDVIEAVANA